MAGTKYGVQLCEQRNISDMCTTSLHHSSIVQHLFAINGFLFFASSERIKYSLQSKMSFRNEDSSGTDVSILLSNEGGHNSVCQFYFFVTIIAGFTPLLFTFTLKFPPFQASPLSALFSLVLIQLAHFLLLQLTMHMQKQ